MTKALKIIMFVVGLGIVAKILGSKMQGIDWEQKFEAMPEDAPPKWMFRNISAIRENTDRILTELERQAS